MADKLKAPVNPQERRKGEMALSEFADYVDKQQALRQPPQSAAAPSTANAAKAKKADKGANDANGVAAVDDLDDLDDLIDALDLQDAVPQVPMRKLLGAVPAAADDTDDSMHAALVALLTQRLDDGGGETVFDLGFEHSGESLYLTRAQWDVALQRLERAAESTGAACELVLTRNVGGPVDAVVEQPQRQQQQQQQQQQQGGGEEAGANAKQTSGKTTPAAAAQQPRGSGDCTGLVMVRRQPRTPGDVIETRIAVVGNVDAGKSSLLGVLVKGQLDDGRGRARVNLFRHKHEFETGRTSSVGMEILGFDAHGRVVGAEAAGAPPGRKLSWEEIGRRSAKVVTFTDLAGHEQYLRTTVFGMMATAPNYCLLMVAANNGLIGMSKEHLGIALSLNVPVLVVVTKTDICPPAILAQTMKQITSVLKSPGARKLAVTIQSRDECVRMATQFVSQRICPVFQVSNVTGANLDLVRLFLNLLPRQHQSHRYDPDGALEIMINDTFSVPFVGTVVSGVVRSGVVHAGDAVWIGPDANGNFAPTTIRSIECRRLSAPAASAGQSASFALRKIRRREVRKGQVVLRRADERDKTAAGSGGGGSGGLVAPPKVHREFVAEVLVLSHMTTIQPRYQAMLHIGAVAQTGSIIDIDRPLLRTGDRALVAFRFLQRPEYVAVGERLLFREGRTKGLGIIKSVGYDPAHPLRPKGGSTGEDVFAS